MSESNESMLFAACWAGVADYGAVYEIGELLKWKGCFDVAGGDGLDSTNLAPASCSCAQISCGRAWEFTRDFDDKLRGG